MTKRADPRAARRERRAEMQVRLPQDVKGWLEQEAERNWTSQNSEIIRAIRARMIDVEQLPKKATT